VVLVTFQPPPPQQQHKDIYLVATPSSKSLAAWAVAAELEQWQQLMIDTLLMLRLLYSSSMVCLAAWR
jgi:hypothetical protein